MKRLGIALIALAIAATGTPALASYTNNQWQNGWPQNGGWRNGWCSAPVVEHNQWSSLYTGYCGA